MARLLSVAASLVAVVSFAFLACSNARLTGSDLQQLVDTSRKPGCIPDIPAPPTFPKRGDNCIAPLNSSGCNWDHAKTVGHGNECYVNCKPGFHSYHRAATCHNGKFHAQLDCMPNGASCEAPLNSLGCNEYYTKMVTDGQLCITKCKPGFHSELIEKSRCYNGQLNPKIICIRNRASCEAPPNSLGCNGNHANVVEDGDDCLLHCKPGFHMQPHNVSQWGVVAKCNNGKLDATCVRNRRSCKAPPNSPGCGWAHKETAEDGEFCRLHCMPEYHAPYEGFRCIDGLMVLSDSPLLASLASPSLLLGPDPWLLAISALLVTLLIGVVVGYVRFTIGWDSSHPGFSPRYLCSEDSRDLPRSEISTNFH